MQEQQPRGEPDTLTDRQQLIELCVPGLQQPLSLYIHDQRDRFVSRQIRAQGIWEPYETSLLQACLGEGDVFVDVGANIGYFSVVAASLVGEQGAVFAFEPDPDNMGLLRASAAHNKLENIICAVQAGLSNCESNGELFLSEDNLGDHQIFDQGGARRRVAVTLLNGAEYLQAKADQIDLLKVDTQGSEYLVMLGLMPLLKCLARKPRILLELTPYSLRQCGASGRQLIALLEGLQQPFWIVDHIEHRLVASSAAELARWCDDVDAVSGDEGFMNILIGEAVQS